MRLAAIDSVPDPANRCLFPLLLQTFVVRLKDDPNVSRRGGAASQPPEVIGLTRRCGCFQNANILDRMRQIQVHILSLGRWQVSVPLFRDPIEPL